MTTFADLSDLFDPDLHLTVNGKVYTVTAPSAQYGQKVHRFYVDPTAQATGIDQLRMMATLLGATETDSGDFSGGVWSEIVADGHDWATLYRIGRTALLRYGLGEEPAAMFWNGSDAVKFGPASVDKVDA